MDDLVTWLRAQIDLDEAHARKDLWALDQSTLGGQWQARYGRNLAHSEIWAGTAQVAQLLVHREGLPDGAEDQHERDALLVGRLVRKARERAERVLREVESKRRIVAQYEAMQAGAEAAEGTILAGAAKVRLGAYEFALKCLALPFADREGLRDEWRP